jgi:eukaryotic-like serine/threonine-protein kinase
LSAAKRYWAFISYSHADEAVATWLHRALETYRLPARLVGSAPGGLEVPPRLFPVFRDRDELASSDSLGDKINEALARAEALIVIAPKNAAGSRWVNEEIRTFKALGKGTRVFCVIADGEPFASEHGAAEAECFPRALRYRVGEDGQISEERAEPIAADIRPGKDGRHDALLKLVAGILNLGLDALKQRDLQRRQRRLTLIAVAAVVASAFTTGLSFFAFQARNEAEAQRQLAEARQAQAEGLIQFMLGDLRGKLEPIGQLAILDAVGEQAMRYFEAADEEQLSAIERQSRINALRQIGEVRLAAGDLDGASAALRRAMADLDALPASEESDFERGQIAFWQGAVEVRRLDLDAAASHWERYRAISQHLYETQPASTRHALEFSAALTNLGSLHERQDDPAQALVRYREAAALARPLLDADPGNTQLLQHMSSILGWLAPLNARLGSVDQSTPVYEELIALSAKMLDLAPGNAGWRRAHANNLALYGEYLFSAHRQHPDLPAHAKTAVTLLDELHARDPDNALWASNALAARILHARVQDARNEPDAAAAYDRAWTLFQTLQAHPQAYGDVLEMGLGLIELGLKTGQLSPGDRHRSPTLVAVLDALLDASPAAAHDPTLIPQVCALIGDPALLLGGRAPCMDLAQRPRPEVD